MGSEADKIFSSFYLSDDNKRKFKYSKKYLMDISYQNVLTFSKGLYSTKEDNEGESVEHFITALYTLSEHCNFGDMRDQLIRDLIIVGIRDSKLSEKMQLDPDLTLEKAIILARQSETVKKQ